MAGVLQKLIENGEISLNRKDKEDFIELKIVSNGFDTLQQDISYKVAINDGLGGAQLEPLGMGANFWNFTAIFISQEEKEAFKTFYEKQKPFILVSPFYPELEIPLNFASISNFRSDVDGTQYYIDITITDAKYIEEDENLYLVAMQNVFARQKKEKPNKKNFLDKMKDLAKKVSDFSSDVNSKVGAYTSAIDQYATTFNQLCQGLASTSTIVTNPINSVKDSLNLVVGGVGGIINALYEIKITIKNVPSDIGNVINQISSLGDQFKNLFKSGENYNEDITYNTQFLQELAETTVDNNFNEGIYGNSENSNGIRNNNDALQFLLLNGIITGIYENLELIDTWVLSDLDSIKKTENKLYKKLISYNFIDSNYIYQLNLLRSNFYSIYANLYENGNKIIEYNAQQPISIYNIVYAINGNLDFLDETIKLNNIVKPFVFGKIKVIANA